MWIQQARSGDKVAFQQLYARYIGQVYALCWRLTADKALAEDATQDVFIQLWYKLNAYQANSKFSTWLHSVTSNITISYMRKQKPWWKNSLDIEETQLAEQAPVISDEIDLEDCIAKLPERARIVFVLHGIEGYRHEEIAEMTKMAVGSSKAQFNRAKLLIKEWMSDE
jgi:RNA polymerase sigma-70 factor (ECF subfamily)